MQRLVLQYSDTGSVILAARQPPIENLVFGGGGMRGVVYPGAVKVLHKHGMLKNLKRVAGSSSGALSAAIMGFGYTPLEFEQITMNLKKIDFVNVKLTFASVKKFFAGTTEKLGEGILSGDGMLSGDTVYKATQEFIRIKIEAAIDTFPELKELNLNIHKITFQNLHDMIVLCPKLGFKDIFITATNKTDNSLKVFSYDDLSTQHIEIALAVRMSMSIPVLYQTIGIQGKYFEDGGILNNFPIDIFDRPQFLPRSKYFLGESGQNLCTLGLKVDTAERMHYLLWHNKQAEQSVGFFAKKKARFTQFKSDMTDAVADVLTGVSYTNAMRDQRQRIRERYHQRTVQIDDQGIKAIDFSMNDATKQKMIHGGRDAMQDWCDAHQDELCFIAFGHNFTDLVTSLSVEDLTSLCRGLINKNVKILASPSKKTPLNRLQCLSIAEASLQTVLHDMKNRPTRRLGA